MLENNNLFVIRFNLLTDACHLRRRSIQGTGGFGNFGVKLCQCSIRIFISFLLFLRLLIIGFGLFRNELREQIIGWAAGLRTLLFCEVFQSTSASSLLNDAFFNEV